MVCVLTGVEAALRLNQVPMLCPVVTCTGTLDHAGEDIPRWHSACNGEGRHLFTKDSLFMCRPKLVEWPV